MCGIFALVEGLRTERRGGADFITDELTPGDTGMSRQVPRDAARRERGPDSNRACTLVHLRI
jgi:hypothetical protein